MKVLLIIEIALFAIIFIKVIWFYLVRDKEPTNMEVLLLLFIINVLNNPPK